MGTEGEEHGGENLAQLQGEVLSIQYRVRRVCGVAEVAEAD